MENENALISELNRTSAEIEAQVQKLAQAIQKMVNQTSGEIKGEIETAVKSLLELTDTAEKAVRSVQELKTSMDSSPDTSGLEDYQAVLGSVTRAIDIAKAAKDALVLAEKAFDIAGLAALADPIGATVAVVSLLVEGLLYLASTTESVTSRIKEQNEAIEATKEKAEESIIKGEAEISLIERKKKAYDELRQQFDETGVGLSELQMAGEALLEYLPGETTLVDEQTGKYRDLGSAINDVISQKREKIRQDALEAVALETQTQIEKTNFQIQKKQAEFKALDTKEYSWIESTLASTFTGNVDQARANDEYRILSEIGTLHSQKEKLQSELDLLFENSTENSNQSDIGITNVGNGLSDSAKEIVNANAALEDSFKSTYEYIRKQRTAGLISDEQYYAELEKALNENNVDMLGKYNQYWGELKSYQKSAAAALEQKQSASLESLTQKQKQAAQEQISIWSEASDKIISEYTSALQQITSEQENFQKKMQGIAGGLLSTTENENGESETGLTDYSEKLSKLNTYFSALEKLKGMEIVPQELLDEIMSMDVDDALTAMSALQEKSDDGSLKDYIDSYVKFQQQASDAASTMYADAIQDVKTKFIDEYTALINTLPEEMRQSGIDTMKGLVDGILSQKDGAIGQINQMAKDLLTAYKLEMGIESPSKEMKALGSYTTEGLLLGLNEHKDSVETSMEDMLTNISPDAAVNHFRQSFDSVMSSLSAGVSASGVMVGNAGQSSNSVSYVQNNYSPKSLSRSDIYRNTQQMLQLASVRG